MTMILDERHLDRLRALVAQRLGLVLDESKQDVLADALIRRLDAQRFSPEEYLFKLGTQAYPSEEWRRLAEILTVTETYFLRNSDQFRAFIGVALPQRLNARAPSSLIRVLSAGCASGEEPYSLAMAAREELPGTVELMSICAVDVNSAMIAKARRAVYSRWSLRDVPPAMRIRWFQQDAADFTLHPDISRLVNFEERNLIQEDATLWRPCSWDVVFCRNVIMYFDPLTAQAVVTRIARSLVPGGFLFLGHAETLRGISNDFHLCHTHDTFYYRRKDAVLELAPEGYPSLPYAERSPRFDDAAPWIEVVRTTSERIRVLADGASSTTPSAPSSAPAELPEVLASLAAERFEGALQLLDSLPAQQAREPAALLLRAVTLAHRGRLEAAEETCQQLIADDEMSAGAHYVLALCREGREDIQGAVEEDQVAVYLDPDFAMAQVHLGLLTRRLGDRSSAGRILRQALVSLAREEASRLAIFGGGFNREALLALCRAELVCCGEGA